MVMREVTKSEQPVSPFRWDFSASEADMMQVVEDLNGELAIPDNFSRTVPPYDPKSPQPHTAPSYSANPQTTELCATLGLRDLYLLASQGGDGSGRGLGSSRGEQEEDEDEDGHSVGSADEPSEYPSSISGLSTSLNPDEITIEDEWEEEEEEKGDSKAAGTGAEVRVGEIHTPSRMVLPEPKSDASPIHLSQLMKLPPPLHSTPTMERCPPQPEAGSPCEDDVEDATAVRILKRSSNESGNLGSRGTTPIIKRRNQDIYTAVEGDQDED